MVRAPSWVETFSATLNLSLESSLITVRVAIAAGSESKAGLGIECRGINTLTDRQSGDDFAIVGINHGHHLDCRIPRTGGDSCDQ